MDELKCQNCGQLFEPAFHGDFSLHCPVCEDWFDWKEEERLKDLQAEENR